MPRVDRNEEFRHAFEKFDGNITRAAESIGLTRAGGQHIVRKLGLTQPTGRLRKRYASQVPLPAKGKIHRFLLTSCQNDTKIHDKFRTTLETARAHFAKDPRADRTEIWVTTFSYDVASYGKRGVKRNKVKSGGRDVYYIPDEWIHDDNIEIAPGLVWCGRVQIKPTKQRPLTGWKNYTRRKSSIFGHPKIALESVATTGDRDAKLMYTTGAISMQNYIEMEAGQKAEMHHTYGALLVEVDDKGRWFVRQLYSDDGGVFQDLDTVFDGDKAKAGQRVEAITWGDLHTAWLDPDVARLGWDGASAKQRPPFRSMLDVLRPREQHVHDLLDFYSRNHHDIDTPSEMHRRWVEGKDNVADEVREAADVLHKMERPWCKTVVINSNHDRAMERWCENTIAHRDPPNRRFWHALCYAADTARERKDRDFLLLEWALRRFGCPADVKFLGRREFHVICGDIVCNVHGDEGAHGTLGTLTGLSQQGDKLNAADKHTAAILWGLVMVGTSSEIPLPYQKGASAHTHTHGLTYPSGKRSLVTMYDGKWRA